MLATIKSDIHKLLTVRSTYILGIIALLITAFMSFYLEGFWGKTGSAAGSLQPTALREIIGNTAGMAATFACIIAILQVGHEYRYNTIMYTLTTSNSRLKVFLSKLLVLPIFSLLFGALIIIFSIGCYYLGLTFRDASLPAQEFSALPELARLAFYLVAYGVLGFALGMLLRSVIAAIAVFFILPAMVEPLLGLLLKDKAAYLPISALDQIMGVAMVGNKISPNTAVITGAIYLAVLGIVALVLFQRRDAN